MQPPNTTSNSSTITTVKFYIGGATATGGTVKSFINANTGALNPAFLSARADNPTISGTDSEIKQLYFMLNDSQLVDFSGSIILQPTGSLRVTCIGGTGMGTSGLLLCASNIQVYQELD